MLIKNEETSSKNVIVHSLWQMTSKYNPKLERKQHV